jgi:exopolyphosphatase / guanosine-5'-triphosphate,3'-diphosphate pyrophosphatase
MNVAVIDVGSQTVRLLVARRDGGSLQAVRAQKGFLGLGFEVERLGRLSDEKLRETVEHVRSLARTARKEGAVRVETLVTAPGRQSENGAELVERLAQATGGPVRILSPDEEGKLAYGGAGGAADLDGETVAVVDVGGGSTEVVVGTPAGGPAWVKSFDIGALRLTERVFGSDPPRRKALAVAHDEVERELAKFTAPLPKAALAAGGTARSLRKLVGPTLGPAELDRALATLTAQKSGRIAKRLGIEPGRARTLAAGAVILIAVQSRLGVPLAVSRAGLREGAVLALLDELLAAA